MTSHLSPSTGGTSSHCRIFAGLHQDRRESRSIVGIRVICVKLPCLRFSVRKKHVEEKQKEEEWNLPTVKVRSRAPTAGISKTPINFIKAVLKVTDS